MTAKKPLVVRKIGNVLIIKKQAYQLAREEGAEMIFEPIDKAKFDRLITKIVDRIAPEMDKEMILRDALGELPMKNIKRIAKSLEKKRPPKVEQRGGCVELQVGRDVISLR